MTDRDCWDLLGSTPEDFPDLDFPLTFPDIVVVVVLRVLVKAKGECSGGGDEGDVDGDW